MSAVPLRSRLVVVGLEGQPVELLADVVAAGTEPFGEAGLALPWCRRPHPDLHALPGVEQHVDRLVVELLALFRQGAAGVGLQPGDQGQ